MEFKDKEEELIYYSNRCKEAKEKKDAEAYIYFLAKAKAVLEEIENDNK